MSHSNQNAGMTVDIQVATNGSLIEGFAFLFEVTPYPSQCLFLYMLFVEYCHWSHEKQLNRCKLSITMSGVITNYVVVLIMLGLRTFYFLMFTKRWF